MPGTDAGTCLYRTSRVLLGDLVDTGSVGRFVAGEHHVRLEERPGQLDALVVQLGVDRLEHAAGRLRALLDRVRPVLKHLRLDDRDDPGLLAERRVARECVGIRPDAVLAGEALGDRVRRAPFGELRAQLAVLAQAVAQAVEALRDRLALGQGERLRALVDLDPRDDALALQKLRERRAVRGALADRLVEEDHAADVVLGPGGGEEHVAIRAPALLGRLDVDRVEALLDRAVALVGGQDSLARSDQRSGDRLELVLGHVRLLPRNRLEDIFPQEHETSSMPRLRGGAAAAVPRSFRRVRG